MIRSVSVFCKTCGKFGRKDHLKARHLNKHLRIPKNRLGFLKLGERPTSDKFGEYEAFLDHFSDDPDIMQLKIKLQAEEQANYDAHFSHKVVPKKAASKNIGKKASQVTYLKEGVSASSKDSTKKSHPLQSEIEDIYDKAKKASKPKPVSLPMLLISFPFCLC